MTKLTELIRKRGGKLLDLEGNLVNAEPVGKEVKYPYAPRTFKEPYEVAEQHFQKAIMNCPIPEADAYTAKEPRWITNRSVLHWEQRVQYYRLEK